MKINASEIRIGMLLEYKNDLWQVLKTQHVKPGKGGAFAQVEMKSVNKNPIVAIGGINSDNYKNLLLNNADFLAISSYIWRNKKYKPLKAIERLK